MADMNRNQAGLALGLLFAAMHALWVAAVGIGVGKPFLNWLHGLHFVSNPYTVTAFDPVTAAVGIVAAFISGYVIGWAFAFAWNWLEPRV